MRFDFSDLFWRPWIMCFIAGVSSTMLGSFQSLATPFQVALQWVNRLCINVKTWLFIRPTAIFHPMEFTGPSLLISSLSNYLHHTYLSMQVNVMSTYKMKQNSWQRLYLSLYVLIAFILQVKRVHNEPKTTVHRQKKPAFRGFIAENRYFSGKNKLFEFFGMKAQWYILQYR